MKINTRTFTARSEPRDVMTKDKYNTTPPTNVTSKVRVSKSGVLGCLNSQPNEMSAPIDTAQDKSHLLG